MRYHLTLVRMGIMRKSTKIKCWFFEKINQINELLPTLTKKKERLKLPKSGMKKRTSLLTIQKFFNIIKEYYEQLYTNILNN